MTVIYNISVALAKTTQVYQSSVTAIVLIIVALLSYYIEKVQYFTWCSTFLAGIVMIIMVCG